MKLRGIALLVVSAAAFSTFMGVTAQAKTSPSSPPVVRRVHDGKELKVGDVFGQLKTIHDASGRTKCVLDRQSTEVSVETEAGQDGGVSLQIDENCVIRVVAVGAYADAEPLNVPQTSGGNQ
jgi:hypothetical protein